MEIKKRMTNKVTRSLAYSAGTHLFTSILSTVVAFVTSNSLYHGAIYGPYLSCLFFVSGLVNFTIYMICHTKFRIGFQCCLKKVKNKVGLVTFPTTISSKSIPFIRLEMLHFHQGKSFIFIAANCFLFD